MWNLLIANGHFESRKTRAEHERFDEYRLQYTHKDLVLQMPERKGVFIPRDILLVEINRRCFFADCNARTLLGLTKQEAGDYHGFECAHCRRWNDDHLSEEEVPEAWNAIIRRETSFH